MAEGEAHVDADGLGELESDSFSSTDFVSPRRAPEPGWASPLTSPPLR